MDSNKGYPFGMLSSSAIMTSSVKAPLIHHIASISADGIDICSVKEKPASSRTGSHSLPSHNTLNCALCLTDQLNGRTLLEDLKHLENTYALKHQSESPLLVSSLSHTTLKDFPSAKHAKINNQISIEEDMPDWQLVPDVEDDIANAASLDDKQMDTLFGNEYVHSLPSSQLRTDDLPQINHHSLCAALSSANSQN